MKSLYGVIAVFSKTLVMLKRHLLLFYGFCIYKRWNSNLFAGNCDCSSLVIHSLREAGFDTGAATYTENLSRELTVRGWQRIPVSGNPVPGDILLNDKNHVAVCVASGLLSQASTSETGGIVGAPGDQTGRETSTGQYYDLPWNCYLRYTGPQDNKNKQQNRKKKMEAIIQINDGNGLNYFDGTRLHPLSTS